MLPICLASKFTHVKRACVTSTSHDTGLKCYRSLKHGKQDKFWLLIHLYLIGIKLFSVHVLYYEHMIMLNTQYNMNGLITSRNSITARPKLFVFAVLFSFQVGIFLH